MSRSNRSGGEGKPADDDALVGLAVQVTSQLLDVAKETIVVSVRDYLRGAVKRRRARKRKAKSIHKGQ